MNSLDLPKLSGLEKNIDTNAMILEWYFILLRPNLSQAVLPNKEGEIMTSKALVWSITFLTLMIPLCAQFAGGSGTPEDPYLVANAAQLHSVRTNLSAHYRQIAEINFTGTPYGGGTGWLPIGTLESPFTGSYDGDNYQIWGLNIHRSSGWSGLFSTISHGSVKNVQLWSANVICEYQAASLVGYLHYSSMENCSVNASSIEGYDFTGGLVSRAYESSIVSCSADISLIAHESVGGIVGLLSSSCIRDCYAQFSSSNTWYQVGGIVGTAELGSSIIDCSFSGYLYSNSWSGGIVGHATYTRVVGCTTGPGILMSGDMCGGIVGQAYIMVDIINCSSSMDVVAHLYVGGIVGVMENYSTAHNCHASGNVRSMHAGGFVGGLTASTVTDCYSTGSVQGRYSAGGFVCFISTTGSLLQNCYSTGQVSSTQGEPGGFSGGGSSTSSINCYWDMESSGCSTSVSGEGRTTAQMTSPAEPDTYVNWDFASVWNWDTGPAGGYPGLSPLPVSVDDPIVPALTRTAIKAYPNPFSTQATISFELKEAGACKLSLYDIKGRKVKQLMASSLSSGVHQFMFSAWDDKGNRLPSGRYLIGLEHNGLRHLKRITLSR